MGQYRSFGGSCPADSRPEKKTKSEEEFMDEKYEKGRPSTCGGHVGVARVGRVVPL